MKKIILIAVIILTSTIGFSQSRYYYQVIGKIYSLYDDNGNKTKESSLMNVQDSNMYAIIHIEEGNSMLFIDNTMYRIGRVNKSFTEYVDGESVYVAEYSSKDKYGNNWNITIHPRNGFYIINLTNDTAIITYAIVEM